MKKKINFKKLAICIILTLLAGGISYLLSGNMEDFKSVKQPSFAPPAFLFPIAWTILYTLMGISIYIINSSDAKKEDKSEALKIYILQLIVNVLWTPIFFRFKMYFIGFIWIIFLIFLVIHMMLKFYKIKPISAYLQIPYILWLIFAGILSYSIFLLN